MTPTFRKLYRELPENIQKLAGEKYCLFQADPFHPSLEFQSKGKAWTVAVGRSYRCIGRQDGDDIHWVWIGSHEDYNKILQRLK